MKARGIPIWEYASAPFAISFAPGLIAPGNDVLIVQTGHSAYVTKVAQACPDQRTWSGRVWNTVQQGDVAVAQTSAKKLTFTLGTGGTSRPAGHLLHRLHDRRRLHRQGALHPQHLALNERRARWPTGQQSRLRLHAGSVTAERTSFAASGDVTRGRNMSRTAPTRAVGSSPRRHRRPPATCVSALPQGSVYSTEYRDGTTAGDLEADRHGAGLSRLGQPRSSGVGGPALFPARSR